MSLELLLNIKGYSKKNIPFNWIADVDYYIPDDKLIYRIKDNYYNKEHNLFTNNLGLKTNLTQIKFSSKPIIILGDSFVWGNTSNNLTYPALLEKILRNNSCEIQVLNAGISGYGTDQEYLFFTERILPKIRPSILIWNININDIYDNIDRPLFDMQNNQLVRIPAWKNGYFLNGIFRYNLPAYLKLKSKLVNFISYKLSNVKLFHINSIYPTKWSVDKMHIEFVEMSKMAQKYGFKLLFVISPSQNIVEGLPNKQIDLEAIQLIKDALGKLPYIDQNEIFIDYIKNYTYHVNNIGPSIRNILGLSTIDTSLFLDETDKFTKGQFHPNILGNYLMASSVFDSINILK